MQDVYAVLHRVAVVVDFRGKVRQKVVVVLSRKRHEFACREEARAGEVPFLRVSEVTSKPKHTVFAVRGDAKRSKPNTGMEIIYIYIPGILEKCKDLNHTTLRFP